MRIVPRDRVTQQRVSQLVHLNRVYNIEVYDATAASRYNVTDVILREEVPPLNIASEPTYPDKLERFDGVKGDMTRSSKVKWTHLNVRWIVGCLTTVATIAMVMAMQRCKEIEDCSTQTLMRNLSSTCARLRALLFHS
ncbi:hypothetical protein HBI62_010060 [Parastagonospora nodorum]|nr:hypothetical protein HBI62_010060 [Parastagonospora nodorum]KAH6190150.1 hypothetical protein HBI61_010050 [Parastagonospora nodorum]